VIYLSLHFRAAGFEVDCFAGAGVECGGAE
jgi:hypothetical protein